MIYEPTKDHMKSLMMAIFDNHRDSVDDKDKLEFPLEELTESEFNAYLKLSIGYFEPVDISLFNTLGKLQAYLATSDQFDKMIVAEELRDSVYESLREDMQEFLNENFNEHRDVKQYERLCNEGFTPKTDSETGEVVWVKR